MKVMEKPEVEAARKKRRRLEDGEQDANDKKRRNEEKKDTRKRKHLAKDNALENNGKRSKVLDGQGGKPAKVVLPGPSLPLDSHPDRIREVLAKWKMTKPAEVGMTGKQRPPCWTNDPTFVSAEAQKPRKQRGRKKVKVANETEESKDKPKECKSARKPKRYLRHLRLQALRYLRHQAARRRN